jgi:hypothetical protein
VGFTFSRIKPPTGLITLVLELRENLLLYSSNLLLGFSNWPVIYYIFARQLGTEVFCRRCCVLKNKLSHHHHRAIMLPDAYVPLGLLGLAAWCIDMFVLPQALPPVPLV